MTSTIGFVSKCRTGGSLPGFLILVGRLPPRLESAAGVILLLLIPPTDRVDELEGILLADVGLLLDWLGLFIDDGCAGSVWEKTCTFSVRMWPIQVQELSQRLR